MTKALELIVNLGPFGAPEPTAYQQSGFGAWLRVRAPPGSTGMTTRPIDQIYRNHN